MPLEYEKESIGRTNRNELKQDNFILEIKHTFVTINVLNYGNKLPTKVILFFHPFIS